MRRASLGLTMFALTAAVGCALLPRAGVPRPTETAARNADLSSAGIDFMPVGTAKQVARAKRVRANHRA